MKRRIAVSLFILLASASLCFAQKSKTSSEEQEGQLRLYDGLLSKTAQNPASSRPSQTNASTRIGAPKGKNTWAVRIETGGGITGRHRDDIIINSLGEVTCGPSADAQCAYKLSPATLESLSKLIADATPSKWKAGETSFCNDCYGTFMKLHRRDAKGCEKVYTIYWDDSTFANVPEEARRIFTEASAHTQAQATPQKN